MILDFDDIMTIAIGLLDQLDELIAIQHMYFAIDERKVIHPNYIVLDEFPYNYYRVPIPYEHYTEVSENRIPSPPFLFIEYYLYKELKNGKRIYKRI
jgi:hypothetical protein